MNPIYHILALVWAGPLRDVEVAHGLEDRLNVPFSRNQANDHLRLLQTCGYVATRNVGGLPSYFLTDDGSALLARLSHHNDILETP